MMCVTFFMLTFEAVPAEKDKPDLAQINYLGVNLTVKRLAEFNIFEGVFGNVVCTLR